MSSKIPVFQTRLFWGSELKTERFNFSQSCEKALEPISPQPQWAFFTGVCPLSSINECSWLDVFSALEQILCTLEKKRKPKSCFKECFTCRPHSQTPIEGAIPQPQHLASTFWPRDSPTEVFILFTVTLNVILIIISASNCISNAIGHRTH